MTAIVVSSFEAIAPMGVLSIRGSLIGESVEVGATLRLMRTGACCNVSGVGYTPKRGGLAGVEISRVSREGLWGVTPIPPDVVNGDVFALPVDGLSIESYSVLLSYVDVDLPAVGIYIPITIDGADAMDQGWIIVSKDKLTAQMIMPTMWNNTLPDGDCVFRYSVGGRENGILAKGASVRLT